jgi:hypothetical protein
MTSRSCDLFSRPGQHPDFSIEYFELDRPLQEGAYVLFPEEFLQESAQNNDMFATIADRKAENLDDIIACNEVPYSFINWI